MQLTKDLVELLKYYLILFISFICLYASAVLIAWGGVNSRLSIFYAMIHSVYIILAAIGLQYLLYMLFIK